MQKSWLSVSELPSDYRIGSSQGSLKLSHELSNTYKPLLDNFIFYHIRKISMLSTDIFSTTSFMIWWFDPYLPKGVLPLLPKFYKAPCHENKTFEKKILITILNIRKWFSIKLFLGSLAFPSKQWLAELHSLE
jgi:hypothetical protein